MLRYMDQKHSCANLKIDNLKRVIQPNQKLRAQRIIGRLEPGRRMIQKQ